MPRPRLAKYSRNDEPSRFDYLPDEMVALILANLQAIDSPRAFLDSFKRVDSIFHACRGTIDREAIALSVAETNLEVAFITANLFKFPRSNISNAVTLELERPERWTVNRLIKAMPTHAEQYHFLHIARSVNMLVDDFIKTEDDLNRCGDSMNQESQVFHQISQRSGNRTGYRTFLQQQFWSHELKCRANALRSLGLSCGSYVARMSPGPTIRTYIDLQGVNAVKHLSENEGISVTEAHEFAKSMDFEMATCLGVQMAGFWIGKDDKDWLPSVFRELAVHSNRLMTYIYSFDHQDGIWCDLWFQQVPVSVMKAEQVAKDEYNGMTLEER